MNRSRLVFGIFVGISFGDMAYGAMRSSPIPMIKRSNSSGGILVSHQPQQQAKFSPVDMCGQYMSSNVHNNITADSSDEESTSDSSLATNGDINECAEEITGETLPPQRFIGFSPTMNDISFLDDEKTSAATDEYAKEALCKLISLIRELSYSHNLTPVQASNLYFKVIQAFDQLTYEIEASPEKWKNLYGDGGHICARINDNFARFLNKLDYSHLLEKFKHDIFRNNREIIKKDATTKKEFVSQSIIVLKNSLTLHIGEKIEGLLAPLKILVLHAAELDENYFN